MKREDLVVGKIYRIAGRGPMRCASVFQEPACCLFHTPLGNNYYAAVEEDIRPADAAYVRTHAQELKVALGVQKEPEVLLRWAAEMDDSTPKTPGATMLYCPECNNPLQYQSGRVSFRHGQIAGVFVDSAGKIDAYNWRVHGPGVVASATVICPACGYGTDLKQGQLLANCDVVIEEQKNG